MGHSCSSRPARFERPAWLEPPFLSEPWVWIDRDRQPFGVTTTRNVTFNGKTTVPGGRGLVLSQASAWCWPVAFHLTTLLPAQTWARVQIEKNNVAVPGLEFDAGRLLIDQYAGAPPPAGIAGHHPQLWQIPVPLRLEEDDTLRLRFTIHAAAPDLIYITTTLAGWLYFAPHEVPGEGRTVVG